MNKTFGRRSAARPGVTVTDESAKVIGIIKPVHHVDSSLDLSCSASMERPGTDTARLAEVRVVW
jgi:hypothetical protein